MNVFQTEYEARLQNWHNLKEKIRNLETQEKCILVDNWWQNAPVVNYFLHISDVVNWPDPWELLVENSYCYIARALGMCYTLYMTGVNDLVLVEASDNMGNDVILVLVDDAKYILNYWPDTVVNSCLQDFKIKRNIDIAILLQKL